MPSFFITFMNLLSPYRDFLSVHSLPLEFQIREEGSYRVLHLNAVKGCILHIVL